jgi:hypothetical protein
MSIVGDPAILLHSESKLLEYVLTSDGRWSMKAGEPDQWM